MGFPDTRGGLIVRKKSNFDGNRINQKIYGIEDIVNLVLERMKKLAELGWNGTEHLKDTLSEQKNTSYSIKPISLPSFIFITQDVKELTVFKANGNNLPFSGVRMDDIFQVLFMITSVNNFKLIHYPKNRVQ